MTLLSYISSVLDCASGLLVVCVVILCIYALSVSAKLVCNSDVVFEACR